MRITRRTFAPLFILLVVGCDSSAHPPTDPYLHVPVLADTGVARTFTLQVDTSLAYVARHLHLRVEGSVGGNLVDTDLAEITSSNSAVAQYVQQYTFTENLPGGRSVRTLDVEFALVGVGATTFRARLGNLTDEVTLSVKVMPPTTQALVVDSFYVVEQRQTPEPYLAYWPVLRLREPTGTRYATAIGVYFSVPPLPTRTDGKQFAFTETGLCGGALRLASGASDYAYYVQDYLWANDFVMISLDGTPVPDGSAFARVIVQDSRGQLGTIEVTGPILRGANAPAVPARDVSFAQWTC